MEDWEGKPGKDQSSYPIQTMLAVEGKSSDVTARPGLNTLGLGSAFRGLGL